ncbi:lactoylglutathione lyase [Cadophora sp. MPI-SDFR-AT-0126]|nr:lactoylglutathione lyase [Leotiomycetes sp. MPI-SDFR-AT-0126]
MAAIYASLIIAAAFGSTAAHKSNITSDVTSVSHAVLDLDATVSFYHDVVGLQVLTQDSGPVANNAYGLLTDTSTDAFYRSAKIQIPNQEWPLVLTQYYNVSTAMVKQREQDPAVPGLTLTVKSAAAINTALREINAPTVNGQPVPNATAEGTTSTVWVYDPDGYMVELVQRSGPSDYFTVPAPTITDGPGMKYVIRGQLDLTMRNISQALTFYKGILGLNISSGFEPLIGPGEYEQVGFIGSVFNISSDVLWAAATGNCNPTTRCEYYEYDDPTRVTIAYPAAYPGIGMTSYAVRNLDTVLEQIRSAGLAIVSQEGSPVMVDGIRSIVVRDPSGYLVRLDENPCV